MRLYQNWVCHTKPDKSGEGGLSEAEIQEAVSRKCHVCSLGPRVLRTETAGIAAAGVLFYGM